MNDSDLLKDLLMMIFIVRMIQNDSICCKINDCKMDDNNLFSHFLVSAISDHSVNKYYQNAFNLAFPIKLKRNEMKVRRIDRSITENEDCNLWRII